MAAPSSDGGSAALSAYQRVKERLVGLSLELDDKERTMALLCAAIEKERAQGQRELEALAAELRRRLEAKTREDKKCLQEVHRPPPTLALTLMWTKGWLAGLCAYVMGRLFF